MKKIPQFLAMLIGTAIPIHDFIFVFKIKKNIFKIIIYLHTNWREANHSLSITAIGEEEMKTQP